MITTEKILENDQNHQKYIEKWGIYATKKIFTFRFKTKFSFKYNFKIN